MLTFFYIAFHSHQSLYYSHRTNSHKNLPQCDEWVPNSQLYKMRGQGLWLWSGWDDWGEPVQLGTGVSGTWLQDLIHPSPVCSLVSHGGRALLWFISWSEPFWLAGTFAVAGISRYLFSVLLALSWNSWYERLLGTWDPASASLFVHAHTHRHAHTEQKL